MGSSRIRRSVAALAVALLSAGLVPVPGHAARGVEYASQVGYLIAETLGPYEWEIRCDAADPDALAGAAVVEGREYRGFLFTHFRHDHFHRDVGRMVQVADQKVVLEPGEPTIWRYWSRLTFSGDWEVDEPQTLHLAWAIWGTTATCTAYLDGRPIEFHSYDGTHAFHAGPEAFTGGPFVQEAQMHASAARVLTHRLSGGPSFADIDSERIGVSLFVSDDPDNAASDCHQPYGGVCAWESLRATTLTVVVPASYGGGGGAQGEVWVIHVPPEAPVYP